MLLTVALALSTSLHPAPSMGSPFSWSKSGATDTAGGITWVQVAGGITAVSLEDGALLWKQAQPVEPLAIGRGELLAARETGPQQVSVVLLDRAGKEIGRAGPGKFPATNVQLAFRDGNTSKVELAWNADNPWRGGMMPPPLPSWWGRATADLVAGTIAVTQLGETTGPIPREGWLWAAAPGSPPVPPPFDGSSVMAAPERIGDGSIVMLRDDRGAILLYRWRDGEAAPGAPKTIAHEEKGRRISLAGAGGEQILLFDCPIAASTGCVYRVFSPDGTPRTVTPAGTVWVAGAYVLAVVAGPPPGTTYRLERLDPSGRAIWSRELPAPPPPPPPAP